MQRFITPCAPSILGYLASRDLGQPKQEEDRICLQAKCMRKRRVYQFSTTLSTPPESRESLRAVAFDEENSLAVLGTQGGLVSFISTADEKQNWMRRRQATVTRFTSPVNSISLSKTGSPKRIVCCSNGNDKSSGTIHVGKFFEGGDRDFLLDVYCVMKPPEKQSLYCSTISRYSPSLFAVGAERVIFVANEFGDQSPLVSVKSACLAVEFLGAHTAAAGMRNGRIRYGLYG
jgi:hypothetical protein